MDTKNIENIFLGQWEGILKQKGGVKEVYKFDLYITQIKDSQMIGYSIIRLKDGNFAKIAMDAVLQKNVLLCQEGKILEQNTNSLGGDWCIKKYQLLLEEDEEKYTLRGQWEGCDMNYTENRIYVEKTKL